jgi:hypothetical protein
VPDALKQLVVTEHLPRMVYELRQQPELQRTQRQLTLADANPMLQIVDRQEPILVGVTRGRRRPRAPQQHLHARHQLLAEERLDQIVVSAGAQTADLLQIAAPGAENEDRHVAELADPLKRQPAVHLRHSDVENDDVRTLGVQHAKPLYAVAGLLHAVTTVTQHVAQERAQILLVVDDERVRHSSAFHARTIDPPTRSWGSLASMARVLIIEPEPDLRSLAEQAVLELGHQPVLFDDHDQDEPVDVVILATFDGMAAVANELRRRRHDLPIICLDTRPATSSTRALAPVGHLIEPYTLAQLQNVLDRALDRGAGT